jgi:hypothetical protein
MLADITAIWGSSFFLVPDVVPALFPADFLDVRFTIARPMMAVSGGRCWP